jgi:hypothetical protein
VGATRRCFSPNAAWVPAARLSSCRGRRRPGASVPVWSGRGCRRTAATLPWPSSGGLCPAGRLAVGARGVAADHLDARMLAQPCLHDSRGLAGQHVDAPPGLGVDEHGGVASAAAQCEGVGLKHPRHRRLAGEAGAGHAASRAGRRDAQLRQEPRLVRPANSRAAALTARSAARYVADNGPEQPDLLVDVGTLHSGAGNRKTRHEPRQRQSRSWGRPPPSHGRPRTPPVKGCTLIPAPCVGAASACGLPGHGGNWVDAAMNRVYRLP